LHLHVVFEPETAADVAGQGRLGSQILVEELGGQARTFDQAFGGDPIDRAPGAGGEPLAEEGAVEGPKPERHSQIIVANQDRYSSGGSKPARQSSTMATARSSASAMRRLSGAPDRRIDATVSWVDDSQRSTAGRLWMRARPSMSRGAGSARSASM